MEEWWATLGFMNKGFLLSAFFFSLVFLWQITALFFGVGHDSHVDAGPHHFDTHVGDQSAQHGHAETGVTFSLVSVRSLIAFGTMFSWAGALYGITGYGTAATMGFSFLWGMAGMLLTAFLVYKLVQLQEVGNIKMYSCIGEQGKVTINVPAEGTGEIRVMISGVLSHVKARSASGEPVPAGTTIKVVGIIDSNIAVVEQQHGIEL